MSLSLHFTKDETNYPQFRELIYSAAKENKNILKEFFLEDENGPILANNKIFGYLNKIKEDKFFSSSLEIYIASIILEINIAIYERTNTNDNFKQYSLFLSQNNIDDYMLINFEGRCHYNLLKLKK